MTNDLDRIPWQGLPCSWKFSKVIFNEISHRNFLLSITDHDFALLLQLDKKLIAWNIIQW